MEPETRELINYLDEVLDDYRRFVENIGGNGYAATLLLNYRDEIQEILDELKFEPETDLTEQWQRVSQLDEIVRQKKDIIVQEIGWSAFKQYQIIQDPPLTHWWWYLNRLTKSPEPEPKFWEFWRR